MDDSKIDRIAMGRLAKALDFILNPTHEITAALRLASETGAERDIKKARTMFLKLKPGDRRAALSMIED